MELPAGGNVVVGDSVPDEIQWLTTQLGYSAWQTSETCHRRERPISDRRWRVGRTDGRTDGEMTQ